eukprot:CAMPEP_0179030358 /NCGR_PEP_ID=MMETSP0796-20121207/10525_1 /TAXON_ID=73915 /ORGANISM="Pyrodinium bahamense, Strain pbaha01" /LENGTH=74 /DNA_ID=CAMNT_0020726539 /DNA_START=338 /DNA_END=559 /DNA_ORIENTATION=-
MSPSSSMGGSSRAASTSMWQKISRMCSGRSGSHFTSSGSPGDATFTCVSAMQHGKRVPLVARGSSSATLLTCAM